jgi:hypothetical protein
LAPHDDVGLAQVSAKSGPMQISLTCPSSQLRLAYRSRDKLGIMPDAMRAIPSNQD